MYFTLDAGTAHRWGHLPLSCSGAMGIVSLARAWWRLSTIPHWLWLRAL